MCLCLLGQELLDSEPQQPYNWPAQRRQDQYLRGNPQAADSVIEQIRYTPVLRDRVTFIRCDLILLSSVKAAATDFVSKDSRLDALLCNAGITVTGPGLTKDGYEI
ncbi:hypothetical protein BJX68DRAFT_9281 [Aspergillus pseudodeflectus]|uniref:Uncharacterized protein n=1 Tax=Aspergillus pseudodeflectus TaxID=176178 RepID=A0ABR4LAR7_9EURO